VARGWVHLHNEDVHSVYISPNIIRIIKWRMKLMGYEASTGEIRNVYKILVGKYEGKRPL
jgi:hypothetical protein